MVLRKSQSQDVAQVHQIQYEAVDKNLLDDGACAWLHIVSEHLQHSDKQDPDIGFCAIALQDVCQCCLATAQHMPSVAQQTSRSNLTLGLLRMRRGVRT